MLASMKFQSKHYMFYNILFMFYNSKNTLLNLNDN